MLEVSAISLSYGKHLALNDVSIRVTQGQTVVVLGANGAGKSSLLKAIGGLAQPAEGASVRFGGAELIGRPAHEFVEIGIAFVPEGRGLFGDLTVAENLSLGAYPRRARGAEREGLERVYGLFPKLKQRQRQTARTMSGGEQQMLAIGRALMSRPSLLLLDEPSLGLAPIVTGELFRALERVRDDGVSLLIVEQNVRASLAIADYGYLMETGRVVGQDKADALKQDTAVRDAFLGMTGRPQTTNGALR